MANLKDLQKQAEAENTTNEVAQEVVASNKTFMGLVGPEGVGKTGIVLDSLTDEEVARGDVIFVLDFDGGGQTIRASHHRSIAKNIRVLNPNVMQTGDARDSFDYPATHRRVMNIGRTLVDWAAKPGDRPILHSVLVTGIDQWDAVASNCMFIEDLGTAPDGIGAKIKPHEQIGMRFNWQIRSTRFHQLTVRRPHGKRTQTCNSTKSFGFTRVRCATITMLQQVRCVMRLSLSRAEPTPNC